MQITSPSSNRNVEIRMFCQVRICFYSLDCQRGNGTFGEILEIRAAQCLVEGGRAGGVCTGKAVFDNIIALFLYPYFC